MNSPADYILEEARDLIAVDSPTSYMENVTEYLVKKYQSMGYRPELTIKGGILVELGGKKHENSAMLAAHADTLGAVVAEIKKDGRLRLSPVGGLNPNNIEGENCRVITRFNGVYTGMFQLENASIHVNSSYNEIKRGFDTMEVVLDEFVDSKEDAEALGIMTGDVVCFDPRTVITPSGYIKSRFLDDKLSVAILLGYARYLQEERIVPERKVYQHITIYEEVGHGCSASVPMGVTEIISVDMGCVGVGLQCTERQVSICAKDTRGPYCRSVVTALVQAARKANLSFAVDVYPHYGSDAEAALAAGFDVRHGLIGPGVYASHGYERSHRDGVANTLGLLKAYLG